MDFAAPLRTLFQLRGKAASYLAPAGDPVPLRAIRQGGGQAVAVGPVLVMLERVQFHVRRADVPVPVVGAVLTVGSDAFTVQAVQPVLRDADGLLWSLDAAWGMPATYRTGGGTAVQGGPWSVVTAKAAGSASVSVQSAYTNVTGALSAGDTLTIGGTPYTVGGAVSPSGSKAFNNVAISPALAAPVAVGAAVTITQASAAFYALTGAMADYTGAEVMGSVLVGDRRMVVLHAAFVAAGLPAGPKPGATVDVDGRTHQVIGTRAHHAGSAVVAWELQVRT